MANPWIDVDQCKKHVAKALMQNQADLALFGSTINQVHEAFVFGELIRHYRERGWTVAIENPLSSPLTAGAPPPAPRLKLKFSTRGKPSSYSYARCSKGRKTVQIHHQLRVSTATAKRFGIKKANICLDVAVLRETNIGALSSDDPVDNNQLITFGEAKHMSAFAELVAAFVGLVHELQPKRISSRPVPKSGRNRSSHPLPFMYVSGWLNPTGRGLYETIEKRGFAISIYSQDNHLGSVGPSMFTRTSRTRAK